MRVKVIADATRNRFPDLSSAAFHWGPFSPSENHGPIDEPLPLSPMMNDGTLLSGIVHVIALNGFRRNVPPALPQKYVLPLASEIPPSATRSERTLNVMPSPERSPTLGTWPE